MRKRMEDQRANTALYLEKHPKAKRYTDFREMLEKRGVPDRWDEA